MPRTLWLLVIGMFINVTGASFLWPLNTIYIHQHLGKSLTAAGFVLMLNSGANVLGNLFGGYLFDKIGGFKTVVLHVCEPFWPRLFSRLVPVHSFLNVGRFWIRDRFSGMLCNGRISLAGRRQKAVQRCIRGPKCRCGSWLSARRNCRFFFIYVCFSRECDAVRRLLHDCVFRI